MPEKGQANVVCYVMSCHVIHDDELRYCTQSTRAVVRKVSSLYVVESIRLLRAAAVKQSDGARRKDLRYLSFKHFGCRSRALKDLPIAVRDWCMGWERFSTMHSNLDLILLSTITSPGSARHLEI